MDTFLLIMLILELSISISKLVNLEFICYYFLKKGFFMMKEKIDKILKKRKDSKKILEGKRKALNDVRKSFNDFDIKEVDDILNALDASASNSYNKSNRNSLNILVTGVARQGKSTFLQTITALNDKHIPASDGKDLTASKSIIKNSLENKAVVKYLEENEFLNIINSYYKELDLSEVNDLDEFSKDNKLDTLEVQGTRREYLNYLVFLRDYLNEFRHKLGIGEEEIEINEIRRYVAYEDENGNRDLYLFAAVKEVVIFTEFQNKEVGKIAFIDLPGINDVKVGLLERVAKEVKENVDAIFIMKKPSSEGDKFDNNDHELYDVLSKHLGNKAKDLTYVIINKTSNNAKQCEILYEDIHKKNSSMDVKNAFIVNVKDKDEVNDLMNKVLEDIVKSIEKNDKEEFEEIDKNFKLLNDIIDENERELVDIYADETLIDNFIRNLKYEFNEIINEIKQKEIFKEIYQENIISEIEERREEGYLKNKRKELEELLAREHHLNISIETIYFIRELANEILFDVTINVDEKLNVKIEELKSKVSTALVKAGFNADEATAFEQFIQNLNDDKVKKIRSIFKEFYEFKLDFKAILEAEIVNNFNQFLDKTEKDIDKYKQDNVSNMALQLIQYDLDDSLIQLRDNLIRKYKNLPDEIVKAILFKTLETYVVILKMQDDLESFIRKHPHLLTNRDEITKNRDISEKIRKIKKIIEGVINAEYV